MTIPKQVTAIVILTALVSAGVAAVRFPKPPHKNLKVLPQDISDEKLDSMMKSYNKALDVECSFCHVKVENFPDSLDYVSDDNHRKDDARKMISLTIYLNKTYFNYSKSQQPEYLNLVQCMTCHRGDPYPEDPMPLKPVK